MAARFGWPWGVVMTYIVIAYMVMTYPVMTFIVIAYMVMTYPVMTYIVMAFIWS